MTKKYGQIFRIKPLLQKRIKFVSVEKDASISDIINTVIESLSETDLNINFYLNQKKLYHDNVQVTYRLTEKNSEKINYIAYKHNFTKSQVMNLFLSAYLNSPLDDQD